MIKETNFSNVDSVGWIYIAENEHVPGKVKVGRTFRQPQERMSELAGTGVPGTPALVYAAMVPNPEQVEKAVHEKLSQHKVPDGTSNEWFKVSPEKAYAPVTASAPEIYKEEDPKGITENSKKLIFDETVPDPSRVIGRTIYNWPNDEHRTPGIVTPGVAEARRQMAADAARKAAREAADAARKAAREKELYERRLQEDEARAKREEAKESLFERGKTWIRKKT